MKQVLFIVATIVFGSVRAYAQCAELRKFEKEHSDWKVKFREVQTTPLVKTEESLAKYRVLARPVADRLERVDKLAKSETHKTNIMIVRRFMDRLDKGEYTDKYAVKELSNVLPNFEDDTAAAILNAQLKFNCPDLGLEPGKPLGPHKTAH